MRAGNENLENNAANIYLLLRDVALPLLCRDQPVPLCVHARAHGQTRPDQHHASTWRAD